MSLPLQVLAAWCTLVPVPVLALTCWKQAQLRREDRRALVRAQAELRCALDRRQPHQGPERLPPEALRLRLERLPANSLLLTGAGGTVREVHPPDGLPYRSAPHGPPCEHGSQGWCRACPLRSEAEVIEIHRRHGLRPNPLGRPVPPLPTSVPGPGRKVLG